MKNIYLSIVACLFLVSGVFAQQTDSTKYRRSSLYTVLIKHGDREFGQEIGQSFLDMPHPDKFDNHDLPVKVIGSSITGKPVKNEVEAKNLQDIDMFVTGNAVPRKLVAKWFARDDETGAFDMALVGERGQYDASMSDVNLANLSARGEAMLSDAGEELIGKTFVLVNDITYFKKEEATKKAGGWMRVAGQLAGNFVDGADQIGQAAANITEQIGGFTVTITSYLYRLNWTPEVQATFYQDYWISPGEDAPERKELFENSDLFGLTYVGSQATSAGNIAVKGVTQSNDQAQIMKVCVRALDKSIVDLQRKYDEFQVNVPISQVNEKGEIFVQIGLKEGINERSRFAVLQVEEDADGKTSYKKVGVIAPVKGQIWDNRFMAAEEAAAMKAAGVKNPDKEAEGGNVNLTATQFSKVSGITPYTGLLIREEKIKVGK